MPGTAAGRTCAGGTQIRAMLSAQSVILVAMLPFLDVVKMAYIYTAVPLHFIDASWPLTTLGAILSMCYVPRVIVSAAISRFGDFLCVPVTFASFIASACMALHPNELAAVWVGCLGSSMGVVVQAHRGLLYRTFGGDDANQRRAMRIFTFFDVVGYSCGALLGGVLYDYGGFSSCAIFQLVIIGLQCFLSAALPVTRASLRDAVSRLAGRRSLRNDERSSPAASTRDEPAVAHLMSVRAAGICLPTAVMVGVTFVNLFVYGVEWSLYAIYFRDQYSWSGMYTGLAQMAGDLIAALILLLSTQPYVKATAASAGGGRCLPLVGLPFNVSVLLMTHACLMVMLAQSNFVVALLGQILMGTCYVFIEQCCAEMAVVYANGNRSLYRKLALAQYLAFCASLILTGYASLYLYENVGPTAPFYVAAAVSVGYAIVFGAFYGARLLQTAAGLRSGLEMGERELLSTNRHAQVASGTRQSVSRTTEEVQVAGSPPDPMDVPTTPPTVRVLSNLSNEPPHCH